MISTELKAVAKLEGFTFSEKSEERWIKVHFDGVEVKFDGQFQWGYRDIDKDRVIAGQVIKASGDKEWFIINIPLGLLELGGPNVDIGEHDSGLPWVLLLQTASSTTGKMSNFYWEEKVVITGEFECQLVGSEPKKQAISVTHGSFLVINPIP
ncbi:hypothetical protein PAGU2196_01730 [Pseudomonas sp. PAGU 2196]|uniref:hypothetical protein n=1 Tax=Pseudomonas sp. PAGU 2196 TaxID=2793997 RepID=UPI001EDDC592|nr:hypothetical protein [Pseudomonas sp. PAGU 2196]GHS79339.1 hypothetical protein PAGU2196_01730 [Pseudomonas sp. PAGU 2196]